MKDRGLTPDYVRNHELPPLDPYEALRAALDNLIQEAGDWLERSGECPEALQVATLAIRAKPPCCIDLAVVTDIQPLAVFPSVESGIHIPCINLDLDPKYE